MKNIELKTSGLQCDNPSCDWEDTTIEIENMSDWINKPCPKCGENVFTYNDFLNAQRVLNIVNYLKNLPDDVDANPSADSENVKLIINTHKEITVSLDTDKNDKNE